MKVNYLNKASARLYFFLASVLFSLPVLAQKEFREGFIITQNSDTVFGQIDYKEGALAYSYCLFRENSTKEGRELLPSNIAGYGFKNDKAFKSNWLTKDSSTVFMEILVSGKINLYRHKASYYFEKEANGLYELKENEIEVERNGGKYIQKTIKNSGIFQMYIGDCKEVRSHLKKIVMHDRDLIAVVLAYNNCDKEPVKEAVVEYNSKKPWAKANVGLSIGYQNSTLKFKSDFAEFDYLTRSNYTTNSLYPSLDVNISSPRLYEKLFIHTGISFQKRSFHNDVSVDHPYRRDWEEHFIKFSTLRIPVCIKYQFSSKNLTPYIQAGMGIYATLKSNSSRTVERESKSTNEIYSYREELISMKKSYYGYNAAAGLSKTIGKSLVFYVEAKFERELISGFIDSLDVLSLHINNFGLNTGISF